MNKNIFLSIIFVVILTLFAGQIVLASTLRASLDTAAVEPGLKPSGDVTDISGIIGKLVGGGLQFVSLLFLIIIVYAGIRWMTAQGDPEKVRESRSWMIHAAVGLVITLMAYQIVAYIISHIEIK